MLGCINPEDSVSVDNNEYHVKAWRLARAYDAGALPMCFMVGESLHYRSGDWEIFNAAVAKAFKITGKLRKAHLPIQDMGTETFAPDDIIVPPDRMRNRLDEDVIAKLVEDIRLNGLRYPIVVRLVRGIDPIDSVEATLPYLVSGRHRLEACKRLDLWWIDCTIFDGDAGQARLFEIGENLHRADLTEAERREHVAEWVKLTAEKVRHGDAPTAGGVQPREQGIRKAAKELGLAEATVRRAVAAESLAPEAKAAADASGLGTVARAEAARAPVSEQLGKVADLIERVAAKAEALAAKAARERRYEKDCLAFDAERDAEIARRDLSAQRDAARLRAPSDAAIPQAARIDIVAPTTIENQADATLMVQVQLSVARYNEARDLAQAAGLSLGVWCSRALSASIGIRYQPPPVVIEGNVAEAAQ